MSRGLGKKGCGGRWEALLSLALAECEAYTGMSAGQRAALSMDAGYCAEAYNVQPSPATHAILRLLEAGESVFQSFY